MNGTQTTLGLQFGGGARWGGGVVKRSSGTGLPKSFPVFKQHNKEHGTGFPVVTPGGPLSYLGQWDVSLDPI